MDSFPVYNILLKDVSKKRDQSLTEKEKTELRELISNLDHKGHERIFLIIRSHHWLNDREEDRVFEIPYDGKKDQKDIEFNLNKLPNVVNQMILQFARKHFQTMKEEEEKSKIDV